MPKYSFLLGFWLLVWTGLIRWLVRWKSVWIESTFCRTGRVHYLLHDFLTFNTIGGVFTVHLLLHSTQTTQLIFDTVTNHKISGEIDRLECRCSLLLLNIGSGCWCSNFVLGLCISRVGVSFLLFWFLSSLRFEKFCDLFVSTGVLFVHLSYLRKDLLLLFVIFNLFLPLRVCLALAHIFNLLHQLVLILVFIRLFLVKLLFGDVCKQIRWSHVH